jgi:outer membrane receptor protein involved in Fe transport
LILRRIGLIAGFASLACGASVDVLAAAKPADNVEEIVVTARKRAETLQDAPVAITAISARQLQQYNINLMEDVATLAGGGVLISKNGVSPTLSIRGISSDSTNAGFDQSVGIVIDGVFYDRSRWTQMGFFDAAQVEVLKGPQALYFGKSTVAGALVLTTADPGSDFAAKASVGYEFEGKETYGEGYVSGPITSTLGARLAVHASNLKGYLKNDVPQIKDDSFGADDNYDARLTMVLTPSDDLKFNWKLQGGHDKNDGPQTREQLYHCRGPSPAGTTVTGVMADMQLAFGPFLAPFGTYDDCKLNDHTTVYPGPPGLEFGQGKPFTEIDSYLSSLKIDWKVGDFNVTAVSGINGYNLSEETGYIQSQGLITAKESERNNAYSQELRAISNFNGPVNFLIGANYAHTDFRFRNTSQIILAIPDPRNGRATSQDHVATQVGKTTSVFGELMWDITPQLQFSGGARYTDEQKDAAYDLTFVNQNFVTVFGFPFWLPEGTRLANNFKDTNVSPQATLEWKPQKDLNLFVSYKTGFLPGGFSLGATPQAGLTVDDFLFDSEKVKGFEVGMKTLLLNNTLSLDAVAYSYKFTNLQVNVYVPVTASFKVGNAGEAKTEGIELGARWQASDRLQLHALATYNDGTINGYNGQCYTLQTAAEGCVNGTYQDLSGKSLPRAPKFTATLGGLYTYPVTGSLNASFGVDAYYSDKYQLEILNDPNLTQDSFVRWDASVALETQDRKWRAALFGRNLSNEAVATFGATRGFSNDGLAEIQRLRTVTLEFSHNF